MEYNITYHCENSYKNPVSGAHWQFLVIPLEDDTQKIESINFENSLLEKGEYSINGFEFKTLRIKTSKTFSKVTFTVQLKLWKENINPFNFTPETDPAESFDILDRLDFKTNHQTFLKSSKLTTLVNQEKFSYTFSKDLSIFQNLQNLNNFLFEHLTFETNQTAVNTTLDEVTTKQKGVCQDFAHLFCAIGRANGVPTRYVSGYLHQGNGYFGDSQMHAWVESFIPTIGWIGFDPCNGILAATDYIKVAHGRDYNDCPPIKGVLFTSGENVTSYKVQVESAQQ